MSLATWFMNLATAERSFQAADTAHRRASRNYAEALDDTVDQLIKETRQHRELKQRHERLEQRCDQAVHLLRVLADRSEAFRRAAVHLRRNWTPTDPAELPLKTSPQPLFDALRAGPWSRTRNGGRNANNRLRKISLRPTDAGWVPSTAGLPAVRVQPAESSSSRSPTA